MRNNKAVECNKCGNSFPRSDYEVRTHKYTCPRCAAEYNKRWGKKRPERIAEFNKKYRKCHPDRIANSNKEYRKNHPEISIIAQRKFRKLHPDIYKAYTVVRTKRRYGHIVPPPACSLCGTDKVRIEGHHYDYSRPLDLTWVCHDCHVKIHQNSKWRREEEE